MTPSQGTVIHGTLKSADLLRAFSEELENISKNSQDPKYSNLIKEAQTLLQTIDPEDSLDLIPEDNQEQASEVINDLIDALNDHAPEGYYFGTLEGDASDFGWWQEIPEDIEDIKHVVKQYPVGDWAVGGDNIDVVAMAWAKNDFDAYEVKEWLNAKCFTPEAARRLEDMGINADQAQEEVELGGEINTIGFWVAKGDMSPEKAEKHVRDCGHMFGMR